ncbi:hypothetical protein CRE_02772 [Caenorhabditis remanei]|uniref:Serpentine Receptor, class U n=1 Tax=Caenorhabditis remanei TaxID=31234 RepID=E3NTB5_CAERE|nr:hypothetical protein CRE_02772 [Caenorhabditis remanei]
MGNVQIFSVILMSQFMCLLFFIVDFFNTRLPSTGIFTRWCASVDPNMFLTFIYILSFHINLSTMIFPLLLSSMRLILIFYPQNHKRFNGKLLRLFLPLIFFYPFIFTVFMFPALGYCSSAKYPFQFGAVILRIERILFGNNFPLIFNTLFWMSICLINNSILLVQLWKLRCSISIQARSRYSYRIEKSLTLTSVSMILSFLSNGMTVFASLFHPNFKFYAIMLRPLGNDLYTCVVPWLFYLTHPTFRKQIFFEISESENKLNEMNNVSIQGNPLYINYQFDFFTFPVLFASIPFLYLIPTVFVMLQILRVYTRQLIKKRDDLMNPHVFFIIVLSQFMGFCYMISDYFTIRLPSTGLLTSWCASQEPNHFLKIIFFFSIYFNYTSMLFPFLLSTLRLIPIYYPNKHNELCAKIVKYSTPIIFFYPFLFTFTLIPALGFCRQLLGPYQFGAIYIFFSGNWFNLKLANLLVLNVVFWLMLCLITNILLYKKLKLIRNKRKSVTLQRAEFSLTVTTISMLSSYVTNLVFVIIFIIYPPLSTYFVALRPFGNDCDIVLVPWIFYLTHPAFKRKLLSKDVSRVKTLHTTV